MNLVFLLEDQSMRYFLEEFLPRILPSGVYFRLIAHEGKQDLDKSIPRKLRAWRDPEARFVILRDQDSGDCKRIKERLASMCQEAGKPDVLIRIACRELEAWYIADLRAVDEVFGTKLSLKQDKQKFRDPDRLGSPANELIQLVPGFGKTSGARQLGPKLDPANCRSKSFASFVNGVLGLVSAG